MQLLDFLFNVAEHPVHGIITYQPDVISVTEEASMVTMPMLVHLDTFLNCWDLTPPGSKCAETKMTLDTPFTVVMTPSFFFDLSLRQGTTLVSCYFSKL